MSDEDTSTSCGIDKGKAKVEKVELWSVDDVVNWASTVPDVLPEDTALLKKERVNGKVLLMLTEDKLRSYGIPGGPALLLEAEIKKLQPASLSTGSVQGGPLQTGSLELGDVHYQGVTTLDGLKTTPWQVERRALCDEIINALNLVTRVLVRAPYSSGKTSLAQLLQRRLRTDRKAHIISLTMANGGDWASYWFSQVGKDWAEVQSSGDVVYVIIDEVQISYRQGCGVYDMWATIKHLGNSNPNVRFICFGAYGTPTGMLPTPIDFPTTISFERSNTMPGMRYTQQEFMELCAAFEREMFTIDTKSANFLYYVTNGYTGIVGWILVQAYHQFKNRRAEGAQELYSYLHSAGLLNSMVHETCRAIPDFATHHSSIELVCKQILSAPEFTVAKAVCTGDMEVQLNNCLKASMVIDDGGMITFAAPIIQNKALAHFFGNRFGAKPASLHEFIVSVVQRFSVRQLTESASRDTQSRLMEAQWQQEFYRAAGAVLPHNVLMSPEYGREQGAKGQVDFYIAEYRWMIEILREGINMTGHEERFEAGGRYEPLLRTVDAWAIIDFRGEQTNVKRAIRANTYHYCFAPCFASVTVHGPAGEQVVPILGDKVHEVQSNRAPGGTPAKLLQQH